MAIKRERESNAKVFFVAAIRVWIRKGETGEGEASGNSALPFCIAGSHSTWAIFSHCNKAVGVRVRVKERTTRGRSSSRPFAFYADIVVVFVANSIRSHVSAWRAKSLARC